MSKETQTRVIAKAICDRKFDIPDWMYEYIDNDVINALLPMVSHYLGLSKIRVTGGQEDNKYMEPYTENTVIKEFFDRVREDLNIGGVFADIIYSMGDGIFAGLLLNKKGWRRVRTIVHLEAKNDKSKIRFVNLLAKYLLSSDELFDYADMVVNTVGLKEEYLIESIYNELGSYSDQDKETRMFRLMDILEVYDDYGLVQKCLSLGIPAFFSNGDITDLYRYLDTFIASGWKYTLDEDIVNVHVTADDTEVLGMMTHIFKYLNRSIIVAAKQMISDTDTFEKYFNDSNQLFSLMTGTSVDKAPIYGVEDFAELITLFGHNYYGISIPAQTKFIVNGGDVKTMFTEDGVLLPEASIIKTIDQLDYLINHISVEDLRFLIYNSVDFVKNIISSNEITQTNYIKILKALFENPINESLWKTLNKPDYSDGNIDFREAIIRKVIALITLDTIFINVPEAMLYIEPSALFVTRNLSPKNIPFIPVTKLIPYLPSIISQNDYIKFNRYCNGVYASLSRVVTMDILIKTITSHKKYGYLGDIEGIDHKAFMDTYM